MDINKSVESLVTGNEEKAITIEDTLEGDMRKVLFTIDRFQDDIVDGIVEKIEEMLKVSLDKGQSVSFKVQLNETPFVENVD